MARKQTAPSIPTVGMDPAALKTALDLLPKLAPPQQAELLQLIEQVLGGQELAVCRKDFLSFVRRMWPGFIAGKHHRLLADAFERIAQGKLKRVAISLPPRASKSQLSSYMFPAWFLGQYPDKQVMQVSHKAELAVGFGRQVRNLVSSPDYQEVFPDVGLRQDSKAAGRWNTSKGGVYYATGVGAGLAGFGGDLVVIDDPHDETDMIHGAYDASIFAKTYDWYQTGPRQRLQPSGAICVIHTRWAKNDLIGCLTEAMSNSDRSDQWEVIEIPAIMPSGESFWPEYWPLEELLATKANIPPVRWNAQYMQQPTGEEGALVKREWWGKHEGPIPECEFVIQAWDTAFRKTQRSDYSVCATFGIFYKDGQPNVILLDLFRERLEFPDLKKAALALYRRHRPDACIIEAKAAGDPLIFEMRAMGVPVQSFTPSRGEDKLVRVNGVAALFSAGVVWVPQLKYMPNNKDYPTTDPAELIEEMAEFPFGNHDDMVDATTLALLRYRQGNFIRLDSDEEDEDDTPNFKADYY